MKADTERKRWFGMTEGGDYMDRAGDDARLLPPWQELGTGRRCLQPMAHMKTSILRLVHFFLMTILFSWQPSLWLKLSPLLLAGVRRRGKCSNLVQILPGSSSEPDELAVY